MVKHGAKLISLLSLSTAQLASCCSDWIMDDSFGLSVRTMDLGEGPNFSLKTQPKGHQAKLEGIEPAKYGHIISVGANMSAFKPANASKVDPNHEMAFAGLNEAGLSCDLHALLNSAYPPYDPKAKHPVNLYFFCNLVLGQYGTVAEVKDALSAGDVQLWGPAALERGGVHFIVRDSAGHGLAVEFLESAVKLYDDKNDGVDSFGVFTNEPPFAWQLENVRHYKWKQSLARPSTAMPGAWYPDERFSAST